MKQLKIESLSVTNWRGQTKSVDFTTDNVEIIGRNESGKSTMMKAFFWLLSGYSDANTPQNHDLFDKHHEVDMNTPLAEVECTMTIGEYTYKVKKVAKATFKKVRGEDTYIKAKSDTYTIYIDDIETSNEHYRNWVESNICPYPMLTYLLNGDFFVTLAENDKDKAIKVLQEIIGEIKPEDFKGDYTTLFKMMERYTIPELEEQTKNRIKPIVQRIGKGNGEDFGSLDLELKAKEESLAKYKEMDFDSIKAQSAAKMREIEDIDKKIIGVNDSIKPFIEKRKNERIAISEKQIAIELRMREFAAEQDKKPQILRDKLSEAMHHNESILKKMEDDKNKQTILERTIETKNTQLDKLSNSLESLREQKKEIKDRVFTAERCAYCGQELPEDKVEELRNKFNDKKSKDLEIIIALGKSKRKEYDQLKEEIEGLIEESNKPIIYDEIIDINPLKSELDRAEGESIRFIDTDEYKNLCQEQEDMEKNLTEIPKYDTSDMQMKKEVLMKEKEILDNRYGQKGAMDILEKEIESLKEERKTQGAALAKLEGLQQQIKDYKDEKARISSSRVNDLLSYCKIETMIKQKDGEWKSACSVQLKSGVRYSTANNGARILTLVDLQRMFCKYFGIAMPIWIDEALILDESSRPIFDNWQTISIIREDTSFKVVCR